MRSETRILLAAAVVTMAACGRSEPQAPPARTRLGYTAAASATVAAEHLRTTLEGFGLEVKVHDYLVLHSKPRKISLTMTAPARRPLSLDEPAIPGDPTSSHPELGGGYVSYSASGNAAAQIEYVKYGKPPD